MDLNFTTILEWLAKTFFSGSTTLAGLGILVAGWAVAAVICLNFKASPAYSVVPMIPICIFLTGYGVLNETVSVMIVLVSSVLVASEFKKVVD